MTLLALLLIGFLVSVVLYYVQSHKMPSLEEHSIAPPLYWIDPMEPQVHYPGPGKSHMGMTLVPVYAKNEHAKTDAEVVHISPAIVENLGVRIAPATRGTLTREIETVGYVTPNENNIFHIHSYAEGWIRNLIVRAQGEPVKKDQLLLQLYSPELIGAQKEYLLTLDARDQNLINSARQKLEIFKISDSQIKRITHNRQIDQLVDMFSPIDGVITTLSVREGMHVKPDTEMMSLVDLSSIWIMAQIFEQQAGWVMKDQLAKAQLPAFPSQSWEGKVDYVYPEVDISTRTLKVRFLFDNPHEMLKPNMYANITLYVLPKENVLSIPTEALIRYSQEDRVIVALGQGQFVVRPVTAGIETKDRVEILSGLTEGENVVTSGQFLIDSEANLKASTQRLSESQSLNPPPLTVQGIGTIENINIQNHTLTLKHEAIAPLKMPEMTMDFVVDREVSLATLKPGDKIQFLLEKDPHQQFTIKQINLLTEKSTLP